MRIAAIIFDLDGTLLDTWRDIGEAANGVLASHAFPTHPLPAYRNFIGEGVTQLFRYTLPPEHCTAELLEVCGREFREVYEAHWNVHTVAYPGVDALLEQLDTRAIRMAVLSNKPHRFTEKCVETLLGGHRWELVLGQREGVPRKPHPAGALEIAQRLGLPPAQFLYLGDTGIDMQTATAAGMLAAGALWGFRPREELLQHGAALLVERPESLLDVLTAHES